MEQATRAFYDKRGEILVKNLKKRHFEAYYCATKEDALKQVLALMPEGSTVGWGGAVSAAQVGVQAAVHAGNYTVIDRDQFSDPVEKLRCMRECFNADFFITGANALIQGTALLTLSKETADIDGGLILRSGSVEVNCAFETQLRMLREEMAAQVAGILFA